MKEFSKTTATLLVLILFAGCSHQRGVGLRTTHPVKPSNIQSLMSSLEMAPDWPEVYENALEDARNPEPDEVATDLTAISTDNPELKWQTIAGRPHVKVVSLVSTDKYYRDSLGKNYNTGSHNIWVTAVPDAAEFVSTYRSQNDDLDDLEHRLRQLLGLTPTAQITHFVEFWVDPKDLFRPAADNEVSDRTAGLNLPGDTEDWYRKWFNELRASQYFQSSIPSHNAYPWTQLGYTYDWGKPGAEQGLSEFVIRTAADVVVASITKIGEYGEHP